MHLPHLYRADIQSLVPPCQVVDDEVGGSSLTGSLACGNVVEAQRTECNPIIAAIDGDACLLRSVLAIRQEHSAASDAWIYNGKRHRAGTCKNAWQRNSVIMYKINKGVTASSMRQARSYHIKNNQRPLPQNPVEEISVEPLRMKYALRALLYQDSPDLAPSSCA